MRIRAFKNLSVLGLGTLAGAGLGFAAQVIFARHLGPSDYGTLTSVLTAINLVSPVAGFGLGAYWLRAFGLEGWGARRWVAPSLKLLGLTCLIACGIILCWGGANSTREVGSLVPLMTPMVIVLALSGLVITRFQLEERYRMQAMWHALPNTWRFLTAAVALAFGLSLHSIALLFLTSAIMLAMAAAVIIRRAQRGSLNLAGHGPEPADDSTVCLEPTICTAAQEAWPFAVAGVFYLIYFQSDILLLYHFSGSESVGIYSVAYSVLSAFYLFPSLVYQQYLLPKQHRWAEHDPEKFLRVFRFGSATMLVLGLVAMFGLILVAPWFIPLVWGARFERAAQLLALLGLCVPFRFLATSVGGTLVTRGNMRRKVWYQGLIALINVALNLVWIPRWGYYGAAMSTVISEICLLMVYLLAVRRHVFGADAWRGWTLRTEGINGLS